MEYEMIREIYNGCDNSKMRDVEIKELHIDDLDHYVDQFFTGKNLHVDKNVASSGAITYNVQCDGLLQRLIFTEM